MDKVSIIIPAYNVAGYIGECLDSIESQTYKDLEIIVVDDGSTDSTYKIANKRAEASKLTYKVLSQKNSGQSAARNHGLKEATGKYIVFVDSDDWLSSKYAIERMVDRIVNEEADFVQCSLEFVKVHEHSAYLIPQKKSVTGDQILIDMLNVKDLYTSPCAKIYSNYFLKKNNLTFMEGLVNEDTAYSILVASKASKAAFLKDVVYSSREREGSTSRSSFTRMFKTMHEVLILTEAELKGNQKFSEQIKNVFYGRYVRSMLYNLLQTAQRSNYQIYRSDVEYCFESTDYLCRLKYKKYLPIKHKLLAGISPHKCLFFFIARLIKNLGYKMH